MSAGNKRITSKMNAPQWNPKDYIVDESQMFSLFYQEEYLRTERIYRRVRSGGRSCRYDDDMAFDNTIEENMLYADMIDADGRLAEMGEHLNQTIMVLYRCCVDVKVVEHLVELFNEERQSLIVHLHRFKSALDEAEFSANMKFRNSPTYLSVCKNTARKVRRD